MEQKLKQRICIEFCVKLQISATETFEMLNKAFPNDSPKRTTVFEWHSRFKAGRISIEDDPRQGRPKFQRTDENVQKITDLIKENPRTTLLELEQDTGISKTTIGRIVTEDLKLKKTPAKFIPRFLTNEQKLCRLATCEDMMEMTRTDPEWKDKIITGDETWVYGYDPETKPQSAEWRGSSLITLLKAKCSVKVSRAGSPCFFKYRRIVCALRALDVSIRFINSIRFRKHPENSSEEMPLKTLSDFSFMALAVSNLCPFKTDFILGKRKKSFGTKSGEYGG
ncbi:hypothetical protein LAZ67_4001900 [Cordylochernes scorpioides]|uniref:Mos1 transposase HTH domain-containing protein n=1 Tax=Cordylochernes scorpioides TaxID=51811 RepID=A0ABY6KFR3_9ARAC|nr:hypothetical protein LAZ67_4001900 [Cordylochernes scorpioides]